jgi:hypothetical protein
MPSSASRAHVCTPPAAPDRHRSIRPVTLSLCRLDRRRPASTGDAHTGTPVTKENI